ncbi:MAG: MoxR family ATPase, partial [Desulfatiglandales bacterium]
MEKVSIDGVDIYLTPPDELDVKWIGQPDLIAQVLAAWMVLGENDVPLNPRLVGKPGVGKTTLAYCAGRVMGQSVY